MNEIMAENKRLTEPLQKAREEVEELRKQVKLSNKYYDQSIIIVFSQLSTLFKQHHYRLFLISDS